MIRRTTALALSILSALVVRAETDPRTRAESSCISCHAQLDEKLAAPTQGFKTDVHAAAGLGCEACHGGDGAPALASDAEAAMSASKGFHKAPDRLHVPELCGRCHADAELMKKYNPQARVDQLAEYRTSVHGKKNAAGDPVPATCIDCHGTHGVRPVTSPDSPVYATNVPATCARCHADNAKMATYGIPTSQYDDYRKSVHAAALLDRSDTAAPACNDCHGNHGASPPGVQSVANVCGQCHGREASLFRASFKKALFDGLEVGECTVCHEHHRIRHPSPSLFHAGSAPEVTQGQVTGSDPFTAILGDVEAGKAAGASWQVVLRSHVPAQDAGLGHRVEVAADGAPPMALDATVVPGSPLTSSGVIEARNDALVATLRLTPLSGQPPEAGDALSLQLEVRPSGNALHDVTVRDLPGKALDPVLGSACRKCHTAGDACDVATEKMYASLASLDHDLRQASALLREAEILGMEVGAAQFELKSKGTTGAVEARALIHSFEPERLVARAEEGKKIAAAAREAGMAALAEHQFRRKGLMVSLALVGLVLVALYLKIRDVGRRAGDAG